MHIKIPNNFCYHIFVRRRNILRQSKLCSGIETAVVFLFYRYALVGHYFQVPCNNEQKEQKILALNIWGHKTQYTHWKSGNVGVNVILHAHFGNHYIFLRFLNGYLYKKFIVSVLWQVSFMLEWHYFRQLHLDMNISFLIKLQYAEEK